jgi:hypothetical protein
MAVAFADHTRSSPPAAVEVTPRGRVELALVMSPTLGAR